MTKSAQPNEWRSTIRPDGEASPGSAQRTVHSGHFMLSELDEPEDEEADQGLTCSPGPCNERVPLSSTPFELRAIADGSVRSSRSLSCTSNSGTNSPAQPQAIVSPEESWKYQAVGIDGSLTALLECMSLAYTGKITNPKWNHFRGVRLTKKNKIRLNNIIWREYHMQYVKKMQSKVVQFAAPLSESHAKPEAIVMEGKYWKRRVAAICFEYQRWRRFHAARRSREHSGWSPNSGTDGQHYEPMDVTFDLPSDAAMDFLDNFDLFLEEQPLNFTCSRDIGHQLNSDFVQPNLLQLQPSLEELSVDVIQSILQPRTLGPPLSTQDGQAARPRGHSDPLTNHLVMMNPTLRPQLQPPQAKEAGAVAAPAQPVGSVSTVQSDSCPATSQSADSVTVTLAHLHPTTGSHFTSHSSMTHDVSTASELLVTEVARQLLPLQQQQAQQKQNEQLANQAKQNQKPQIQFQLQPNIQFQTPANQPASLLQNQPMSFQSQTLFQTPCQQQPRQAGFSGTSQQQYQLEQQLQEELQKQRQQAQQLEFQKQQLQQQIFQQQRQQSQPATVVTSAADPQASLLTRFLVQQQPEAPQTKREPGDYQHLFVLTVTDSMDTQSTHNSLPQSSQPTQTTSKPLGAPTLAQVLLNRSERDEARPSASMSLISSVGEASGEAESSGAEAGNRRTGHVNSELKRRSNINSGFGLLQSLIPSLANSPHSRVSKAALLHKAAQLIRQLKQERNNMETEATVLRTEVESLTSHISSFCSQLPDTGIAVNSQKTSKGKEWFEAYVRAATLLNWKFYIFSLVIGDLFDSYNNCVSLSSTEDFERSAVTWLEQQCSLMKLRPVVMSALRRLCTTTSILHDPDAVPQQALEVVQRRPSSAAIGTESGSNTLPTDSSASILTRWQSAGLCKNETVAFSDSGDDDSDEIMLPPPPPPSTGQEAAFLRF